MILLKLFFVFFKTSLFAIGGAYSFLPLLEHELVKKNSWLNPTEFQEIIALVKIFPGAISIKFATYTGYKIAGISGAIIANFANLLAPALIIIFATLIYKKLKAYPKLNNSFFAIQLAVFAMIIAIAFKNIELQKLTHFKNIALVAIAFSLYMFTNTHPIIIITASAFFGYFFMAS